MSLTQKQLTAIRRIVTNGKKIDAIYPLFFYGGYFDERTGAVSFTDSYHLIMFNDGVIDNVDNIFSEEAYKFHNDNDDVKLKASHLFDKFDNEFHDWYDDELSITYSQKSINELHKSLKEHEKDDNGKIINDWWYKTEEYGILFDVRFMRDVVEALGGNCHAYFSKDKSQPIVIYGECGRGLIMSMNY